MKKVSKRGKKKVSKKASKSLEKVSQSTKSKVSKNKPLEKVSKSKKRKATSLKPNLETDKEMAMDFAIKIYKKFDKIVKAIVLFGSVSKKEARASSDIDIIVIIDDASIKWDQELIAWYREELGKIAARNNYRKEFHITTIKLTTWWSDLLKGDPTLMNVVRYGEALIDVGGFFNPIKALLQQGRISSTPEAIYLTLQRAPTHLQRSRIATLGAIEGLFWAMVDSSQSALMAANIIPPSPEHILVNLKTSFVDKKLLNDKYLDWYKELYLLHKQIDYGKLTELKGGEIAKWQDRTEDFIDVMARLVNSLIKSKYKK